MSEDDRIRLRHMLDAAREAVSFAAGKSHVDIEGDRLLQLALTRLIEIIGEAANKLTPAYRQAHSALPWQDIVGRRNRLIHGDDHIDDPRPPGYAYPRSGFVNVVCMADAVAFHPEAMLADDYEVEAGFRPLAEVQALDLSSGERLFLSSALERRPPAPHGDSRNG